MKQKMINSKFGKLLRRIVGEETGAVMMEYVIVAVLIAAAAVIAVAVFGKTIVGMFNAGSQGMTGEGNKAAEVVDDVRNNTVKPGTEEAVNTNKKFSDSSTEASKSK
ncbi:MAG: hypothetical protein IJG18_11035 [Kiritimatiellae bacterium]|nr:hypothetical protein [Kiritimatiellia bacterium]